MARNRGYRGKRLHSGLRRLIFERDGYRCVYCNEDLSGTTNSRRTLDHVTQAEHGGDSTYDNLVTACIDCNQERAEGRIGEHARARVFVSHVGPRDPRYGPQDAHYA